MSVTTRERPAELQGVTLTPLQTQQIRDIARACGADPDFTLRVMREARVERREGHIGISSSVPASTSAQMRAVDLAFAILRQAYEGPEGVRDRPAFSTANLAAGASDFIRTLHTFGPETTTISEKTTAWLQRQAERLGLNFRTLMSSITTYSTLIETNPDIAREALRYMSGGDRKIEAFVLAFSASALTRQPTEGGNTELYIRTADTPAMLAEYRRQSGDDVLRARPRRVA